jgi:hypothetical protein
MNLKNGKIPAQLLVAGVFSKELGRKPPAFIGGSGKDRVDLRSGKSIHGAKSTLLLCLNVREVSVAPSSSDCSTVHRPCGL